MPGCMSCNMTASAVWNRMRETKMLNYVLAMALASLGATPAAADSGIFKDKTISYIVATGAGGGYDAYGRLIGRFLQKHLPGSRVIVRNVPGAGHIVGANTLYTSRPDGLTI